MKTLHPSRSAGLAVVGLLLAGTIAVSAAVLKVPNPYATIQEAVDAAAPGDTIMVAPGEHAGCWIYKPVHIKGQGNATITAGLNYGYVFGFIFGPGSDGSSISHLAFTVDFPIYGTWANDVTVTQCSLRNPIQGISVYEGCGWDISQNTIVDVRMEPLGPSGGHGIVFVHRYGGPVADNVVSHNVIRGQVTVLPNNLDPSWVRSGIALFGTSDTGPVSHNLVEYNEVALLSSDETVLGVAGILLQDMRPDAASLEPIITDNAIGFNDLRGTALPIALLPGSLADVNFIARNLGENRGHGLHPSFFKP